MAELSTYTRTELAHRSSNGIDVTLIRMRADDGDRALSCVCYRREGAYFEIPAQSHLALDVYYHPFADRGFGTFDCEDSRLAA